MSLFTPVLPVGARACGMEGASGPGAMIHDFESHQEYSAEYQAMKAGTFDDQISGPETRLLEAQLALIIQSARRGQATFTGAHPDATVIASSDFLYELRPRLKSSMRNPRREVRLYCAEPASRPRLILGLHLASKPYGHADELGEQQSAIRIAEDRGNEWEWDRVRREA